MSRRTRAAGPSRGVSRSSPESLLRRFGIETPEEIDLEAIAQSCGATIVYESLRGCEARIVGHGERAIITVNRDSHEYRRRFSAGHELGHWMRDRGRVSFACTDLHLKREWNANNPERRANQYAAELLLPAYMFSADVRGREVSFETVNDLSERYRSSRTATAIRLVELGSFPCMLICSRQVGRWAWFSASPDLPKVLWPRDQPGSTTLAHELLRGTETASRPVEVSSEGWFDLEGADRYVVREDSQRIAPDLVLALLWWKDEAQLLSLDDPE